MDRRWTNHLKDPEEQKKFLSYIKNGSGILDRQNQIIRGLEAQLDDKEFSADAYDSPAWACKQADNIGYRRALREILKINNLDPKEK